MKKGCVRLLGLAVVGTLFGFLASAAWTYVMPKMYESEAVIELKSRPSISGVSHELATPGERMAPRIFAAEFEKIKSHRVLEKVVSNLSLTTRWNVDKEDAIRILKGIVNTQNIRGTDLISIRVRHPNNVDARDITEEVARSYREYRNEIERRDEENALLELNKAVRAQEDKVEKQRVLLQETIEKHQKNITVSPGVMDGEPKAMDTLMESEKLESDRLKLKSQIDSLLKYESEQLMVYAAGLDLPDNVVRNLLPDYQEAQRQLETLKISGLGGDHPTVQAAEKRLGTMKAQLNEGVIRLRATLSARYKMVEGQIKEMEKSDSRMQGMEFPLHRVVPQDYVDANHNFETNQELLQSLKLKKIAADIGDRIPFQTVEIHETPQLADAPVAPNVTLNLVLGTLAGANVFPLAGLLVMGVMRIARGNARAGER